MASCYQTMITALSIHDKMLGVIWEFAIVLQQF